MPKIMVKPRQEVAASRPYSRKRNAPLSLPIIKDWWRGFTFVRR